MRWYFFTALILQKLIWIPTRVVLLFFTHLKIEGLEHLSTIKSNVIFASNHTSELDPILLPASLPFWSRFSPIYYTSREKGFYNKSGWRQIVYGGVFFKVWGAHRVYSGMKDYGKALINHLQLLEKDENLFVFPEGSITPDGSIQPAHGGIGYLVEHTACIVIPVGISGAYRMSLRDFLLRKRNIILRIGTPIYPDEVVINVKRAEQGGGNVYKEEAEYIMSKVKDTLVASSSASIPPLTSRESQFSSEYN